ncbi:GumC family protein [Salinimicrobium sp. TH3]|uniref:GumC family protein n=1 Tax=Salinimicrobium sp. TH3 TaxID=2997342 RepID=UPI00227552DF|nr:tyrosine-protein kinase family protein [Salinimicrobium sp. TH3]MCY2687787.1 polysaccharide biosynthesis tyrosine autokinase [Salinimicrobium sp. TH3]
MSQNTPPNYRPPQEEEIDLREELTKYLRHWPWFVAGVLVCLLGAFLYLRYTTPVYNTVATIIIKDEDKNGGSAGLEAFADLGMFNGLGTNSIENEIGILKSRRLLNSVGQNLQLQVRYFEKGTVRTNELYQDRPFNIQVLEYNEEKLEDLGFFEVNILDATSFEISNPELGFTKKAAFGNPVELPFGGIILTPKFEAGKEKIDKTILVSFGSLEGAVDSYRSRLQVNLTDKNSTLIELALQDAVRRKAQDILDRLIYEYNREAIEDKNQVSLNTAEFIEERLAIISSELDSVETGKQEFKTENRLTNIEAESQLYIENASEFRKEQLEVETQLELANTMIDYLRNDKDGLLPANLGFSEASLVSAIQAYNQMVLERNRVLSGSTELNPVVVNLNDQIADMKANVMQSLVNLRNSLQISRKDLSAREASINSQIAGVPSKEKQFRGILRQQNIKEALYLFLLQKREETNLSLAATAPKAKIVDAAYSSKQPVSPKSKIILLAALILGVLIPFLVIYIKNLMNNKVQSRADMENEVKQIPLVGEIPKLSRGQKEIIENQDRSVLAESFRILHTNLQYLLVNAGAKPGGNTIFITSTVKGEGKTFVAFNLAITLAQAEKKVLIVGGDLRNPQLQRFESGAKDHRGVSDYLVNTGLELKELIQSSKLHNNLDLLVSGSIPPNPSELWRQEKTATLFSKLEEMYDYIIVDTAPAMLVTDTFLINKYADLTLYLVRAGYTEKKLLNFAVEAKQQGKLGDVGYILNDVEAAHFGYGNKYGYYYAYGEEQDSFWKKLKNRAAFW